MLLRALESVVAFLAVSGVYYWVLVFLEAV